MKLIRTVLADDERIGRNRLRRMLEKEADIEIVAECSDGNAAIEAIRDENPDLVFLDINMPGKDGFEVLAALQPSHQPEVVIFVTAYDEHAVRAFEACALDYLLKPASPERLTKALARAREQLASKSHETAPPQETAHSATPHRFVVRSGNRMSFVAAEEIDWVEAAGNYMILHVGIQNHMVRETMASMEAQLPSASFMRVSRSAILNLHRAKELFSSPVGDDAVILKDGQRVKTTRPLREIAERLAAL